MSNDKVILFYLFMLVGHLAHVFEEIWGRFWLMDAVFGLGRFLVVNWVLFCIPIVLFYFVLHGKRWAFYLSMIYAGVMIVNGLGHNIAMMVTGWYFGGFAGAYTGIALFLLGPPLIYYLWKGMPAC